MLYFRQKANQERKNAMKVFKSVVLFCLFVTLFILFSACTPEITPVPSSEGLAYEVNEDGKTATITGIGTCTATEIVIGTEIEGYTVTAIAQECGFSSVYHFCRCFKQSTGKTPTQYALENKIYQI